MHSKQSPDTHIEWSSRDWDNLSVPILYEILKLRQEIFVVEQNCPYLDADGKDQETLHLTGIHNGLLCSYARIFPPNEENIIAIGRVITHSAYRGKGLGHQLMEEAHTAAQNNFPQSTSYFVSAQAHLKQFYERLGYKQSGAGYLEDNIPHIPMLRS
jgi:ElaA protein